MKVTKNTVVVLDYELKVDGEVIDSSHGNEPLAIIHGTGSVIPGFSDAIDGMEAGQSKSFSVAPADGYGEFDQEAIRVYDVNDFPGDITLEPGVQLFFETDDHVEVPCFVKEISGEEVTVDFNHPLAGKNLNFSVDIREVRPASSEELAHGHVHGAHGHHH